MKKHRIKTSNLTVGYHNNNEELKILSAINFELKNNGLYALIGKNGTGKSTLLRTLCGLQTALSGTIVIDDKTATSYNALALAKKISYVSTERIPASNLSVFELVALGRQPYSNWFGKYKKEDISIINTALEQTNTLHLSNHKIQTLSDGQLQKVMLARALAQDTPIIILDEPTTHLDMENSVAILLLLKTLSQHKIILLSTHKINEIIPLATVLLLVKNNTLISGKLSDLGIQNALKTLFLDEILNFDTKTQLFYVKNNKLRPQK